MIRSLLRFIGIGRLLKTTQSMLEDTDDVTINCVDLLADAKRNGDTGALFWLRITCCHDGCGRDVFLQFSVSSETNDLSIGYSAEAPEEWRKTTGRSWRHR